ncbi:3'-5' exoribonuclease HELZ2-like [Eucyclogobius newberryi]|uniref:3'-5' exoribonuclease HELZ2-like n=1 Tax=Eucyclogobius newberryi TaxID=166745 RepID=UPI003B59D4AB
MAAEASRLEPLLAQYDLRLACDQCSVKEKEITYKCNLKQHQCALSLLLCRVKGGTHWRPVSKRPMFPNPSVYQVCWFFREGTGCSQHRNRCTFARSEEEAAVWNFEKKQNMDHLILCNDVAHKSGSAGPKPTQSLDLAVLDLKAVCDQCCIQEKEITYAIKSTVHNCTRKLLLAKEKNSDQWRPVSERPSKCGQNAQYQVCYYFIEGSGCTKDGKDCSFARSSEEAAVWNHIRNNQMQVQDLIKQIAKASVMNPKQAAQDIIQHFPGRFNELCTECFYDRPTKLVVKKWNETCSADAAHTWKPLLVHHPAEQGKKLNQIRPLPQKALLKFCSHVREGKPCWHNPGHCMSAQSEVEMQVWRTEQEGLKVRSLLLQLQPQQAPQQNSMYCKVCFLTLSSAESFYKHCASIEHAQLLREDTSVWWKGRPPPHSRRAEFWLCDRPETCEYGKSCPKAHSKVELQEWMMRTEEVDKIRQNIEAQGLMSYNERLLQEYRSSSNEACIMSENVDDVSISCDEDLTLNCGLVHTKLQWNFRVETERELVHVALLKQEPGACFSLDDSTSDPCIYSAGHSFRTDDTTYKITVSFTSDVPGLYEQWLVLDFDITPVLLKKISVTVGQPLSDDNEDLSENPAGSSQKFERWHMGNRVIVPCINRTEEQEELLKRYKPPHVNSQYKATHNLRTELNHVNYKERMHNFLYDEEHAEDQAVSRLNVCAEMVVRATDGRELLGEISLPFSLTADSPEGLAFRRSIQSALIVPVSSAESSKVYEAIVLDKSTENIMYLQLSKRCCLDLALKCNATLEIEIQFQLNRYHFCSMHKAVDALGDTRHVLPDLKNCTVPVNNIQCDKLNEKQLLAVEFITGATEKCVAPLLIYGPFGTGKTFTLATSAIEVSRQPNNKVLICTHTNSSADLYIRDHFHKTTQVKIKPLRIKAKTSRGLAATDEITLKYCLLNEAKSMFLPPTKPALDQHNVIVITATMARQLHDLKLPEGYFSHILIDEASQMLECEALSALGLAGPHTRVALAGDHMQMGPKLYSVEDHKRSDHTLLTRLFHYYQTHTCDSAQKSRIILNENYRSTREIVDFVSTHFYTGKGDVIKSTEQVPPPPNGHALRFHHVRGKCLLHRQCMTWYNNLEANKVAEAVHNVLQNWPSTWGPKELDSVCVISEGFQIQKIRNELSKKGLKKVQVHSLANVQGLQFRVVIISAVHSRDSLTTRHLTGLELFNDVRVLNTALTRARSLVLVVGDAAALCCFGQCSQIWKDYVDYCIHSNSVDPLYFSKDFFEKDLIETKRFQKSDEVEDDETLNDTILQELKGEYQQFTKELITDNVDEQENHKKSKTSDKKTDSDHSEIPNEHLERHGKLVRESLSHGYVIPSERPHSRIRLNGRGHLGKAFTGDEVIIKEAKVIAITKKSDSARVHVCFLEDEDHSRSRNTPQNYITRMMIPISKSAPKICIHINKKKRNFLPVWKQEFGDWTVASYRKIDEKFRQNHVFLVQVIEWKGNYTYPLGNVIDVMPIGKSLIEGLQILHKQYDLAPSTCARDDLEDTYKSDRKDRSKDGSSRITFTVDPPGAKDLDDAISVELLKADDKHYHLGIHIADVASFVPLGDELDEEAKRRCISYYCHKNSEDTIHMFPRELSTGLFSLLPGQDRSVVSLMFKVDKETNSILGQPKFELSTIKSDIQMTYEEAEKRINKKSENPVDHSLKLVFAFAKARRKERLKNWPYAQPDDDQLLGERKAHFMIEELSVLFNKYVSEILSSSKETRAFVPLRCQSPPSQGDIDNFKKQYADLIPVSFSVWHKVDCEEQHPNHDSFHVLQYIWTNIQEAAKAGDIDRMVDLIAADDIHSQLKPITTQFRKCLNKAYFIRSMSDPSADVGHYSLNLESYTQASSPIRRYIDLMLQRLLHCYILERQVPFTHSEISALCTDFDKNAKKAKEYERQTENMSCAVGVMKQSICKIAFVVKADADSDTFFMALPFHKDIFSDISCMYKNLQLDDQPGHDKINGSVTLKWKRRIYAADKERLHRELTQCHQGPCLAIPFHDWKSTVDAIKEEKWDEAKSLILRAKPGNVPSQTTVNTSPSTDQVEHEVEISLVLKLGDILRVQMTCEVHRGSLSPVIQLVSITPMFELCVDHVKNPVACFSRCADYPSKIQYLSTEDYVQIWKPLCEMESASSAIRDSDSIIIENLEVNFSRRSGDSLEGNFFLHSAWIEEWAMTEVHFSKCLLCIRKPALPLKKDILEKYDLLDYFKPGDPSEFTWVAHGVTTSFEVKKKSPEGNLVNFRVNHLPMEHIPDSIFTETTFTVELIPKTLPDIRKQTAVCNVPNACELVKSIALGQRIPREVSSRHIPTRREVLKELPSLNDSQHKAVNMALNNNFTLIQGPPGTGKTVVGVYIVRNFLEMNKNNPRKLNADSKDKDKKQVILYCGPSNKSVDVVAEYMLRFGDSLKALRVYGKQVENLDYPFPESVLQFSTKTRPDRSKDSLRKITLHHRIRQSTNPHSGEILTFDSRIKDAIKEGPPFTPSEVKEYKDLLIKGRKYEFESHDIILCTCTQSSTPGLTRAVSARQILIDECAMATEPEALIPLVSNNPEKIVLIGDHKQLRPIVINDSVRKLGMSKSLFERYYTQLEKRSVMLDTQYRMHEDICKFPSEEYYEGKLKTGVEQPNSVLRVGQKIMPVVFGHIQGVTVRQVVNTSKGNENSKANREETQKVVDIVQKLTAKPKIEPEEIVVLSPYNAQVHEIKEALKGKKLHKVHVNTITKSQGSEWRYVIISMVCSLPSEKIEPDPNGSWLSKHVGFVGDPNQINVAITRAKEGLCILGNMELLSRSRSWKKLLDHYQRHNAVTDADKISVCPI